MLRNPQQAPQQYRDVGTENPSVKVRLIHDDVGQLPQERRPPRVVRQDPVVQHVRVGEYEVGVVPYPAPFLGWGVAVVGCGSDAGYVEFQDAGELVAG